ncbi:phosphoenolpyruvate carboxylase family protein [Tasmannia lanceolata]|uniref:phosphoenolpyruvate carboxylase family protein n=1 Tax=Tasmannia lanceolata TaxID=3420 RepID=UPI0040639153
MASIASFNPTLLSPSKKPHSPFPPKTHFQTLIKPQNPTPTNFPKSLFKTKPTLKTLNPISSKSTPSDLTLTPLPKTLKTRLASGETLYGLFLLSFSPTLAEIAGLSGYDFAVVDLEHGPGGVSDALPVLHALAATQTPAIIRIPESSPTWAKKALDIGPQGIMFPMIESPKLARKAVSYCRFPPDGVRGSAHPIVRASNYGINDGYLSNYMEDLLIMCQVESEEGVEKIEEIAAVDGVDCIQMGPLDLSGSMGYLWDPGNKKVKEVLHEAEKAVLKKKGAVLGGFAMAHDSPMELKMRGYQMVSGAVDIGLFRSAVVEDVKKFKSFKGLGEEEEKEKDGDAKYWSE